MLSGDAHPIYDQPSRNTESQRRPPSFKCGGIVFAQATIPMNSPALIGVFCKKVKKFDPIKADRPHLRHRWRHRAVAGHDLQTRCRPHGAPRGSDPPHPPLASRWDSQTRSLPQTGILSRSDGFVQADTYEAVHPPPRQEQWGNHETHYGQQRQWQPGLQSQIENLRHTNRHMAVRVNALPSDPAFRPGLQASRASRASNTSKGTPGVSFALRITNEVFTLATFSALVRSSVRKF